MKSPYHLAFESSFSTRNKGSSDMVAFWFLSLQILPQVS